MPTELAKKIAVKAWGFLGRPRDECAAEIDTMLAAYVEQQVAEAVLAEAREWKAHRPGDGFYDRRVSELERLAANREKVRK